MRRHGWLAGALLLVALVHLGSLGAGFVWDDQYLVLRNRTLSDPTFARLFQMDLWCCNGGTASPYYRPLTSLSLLLDRRLWGLEPSGHHLTSLLLHLVAVAFVGLLGERRLGAPRAAAAALVFGLHPIQQEAVVWVAARNDLLAAVGVLGALRFVRPPAAGGAGRVGEALGIVGFGLLGCLSKEGAFVLPLLAGLWAWAEGERLTLRRWALWWVPVVVAAALRLQVRWAPVPIGKGEMAPEGLGDWLGAAATYLGWLVVPWPLTSMSSVLRAPAFGWGWGTAAVGLGVLGLLLWRRQGPLLLAALVAFLPSVGGIARFGTLGERYLYLSIAFLAIAATAAPPPLAPSLPARTRGLLAAGLVTVGSALAAAPQLLRLPDWADDLHFYTSAAAVLPYSYTDAMAGAALAAAGRPGPGLELMDRSLQAERRVHNACASVASVGGAVLPPEVLVAAVDRWRAAGCQVWPGFDDGAVEVLVREGQGEAAARLAADARWDESGRGPGALAALALREGDLLGAAAWGLRSPAGPGVVHAQALGWLSLRPAGGR